MSRYFIELFYKGTNYAGFQIQQNANSIQAEVEKALTIFFKQEFSLTGSSRTDAGVHALSNYFHFDSEALNDKSAEELDRSVYHINAILPEDIVIKKLYKVKEDAHSRFDAIGREYKYYIYQYKTPFLADRAFFFPYKLDMAKLNEAAALLLTYEDFTSFSKKNTQVKTFQCKLTKAVWEMENDMLVFTVKGNRFLRGMVRGLVGTMIKVGTGKNSVDDFRKIIEGKDCAKADFSVPPQGLFLVNVAY
ncbi:MAG TPA: tRNA pseudouridine(38-40) synthase TruA [Ferruginibacter sp.]|nr:tRNA pseudouridine(38-40) synthase TruA [Ferruginibacter sp.]